MSTKIKIALSGDRGSFSEEAANYYCYQNKITAYELVYVFNVENVLQALDNGDVKMGIFPIENSNGGIVYEAVRAMSHHNFKIESFFEIDVRHNLLVLPGTKREDVKKIVSHDQALRQCRMYLRRMWPNIEIAEYEDTALAAKDLASGKLGKNVAVLANKSCADIYGLEMLEKNVQDLKFNFTNFIAATKFKK
jgi:prephenate dehydratase